MKRIASVFALLAGLAFANSAHAVTITQTFTKPQTATNWNEPNIPFNQFDPALGTLNSVSLAFAGSFTQTEVLSVAAGSPPQSITGLTATANIAIFGAANFVNSITTITNSQTVITFPGVTINGGASMTFNAAGALGYGPATQVPITPYIGVGTISLSLFADGGSSQSGAGNINFSITTFSGGTLTLVYDYTPTVTNGVPEPTTMAAAFTGLLALIPMARRRFAKAA